MADAPFTIDDVRGGVNNSDSPTKIADNQVVDARNVDLRDGALGSKRRGCEGISLTSAIFDSPVIALIRHTPLNNVTNDELWGIDANGNLDRRVFTNWQGGVARVNDFVVISAGNYDANGASLHGKLFLAANGTQNRLPVWDGTVLRWAGFAEALPPTLADSAAAGTYATDRIFRIRYVEQSGGVVVRRSEPSTHVSITPSGANTGVVVTKPANTELTTNVRCEGQTHWEVEQSLDGTIFYVIATVAIATGTYTDTTAADDLSADNFEVSEAIGEYIPPGSARHVVVDEDRIVMAGNHEFPALDSTVSWTPVTADDGVGNDERIPTATKQTITFDALDGGAITGLVAGINGYIYPFKRSRIYKMGRTGNVRGAYDKSTPSTTRGALPRAAVAGTDPFGVACVYFLDPEIGLCRFGQRGVEDLADSVRTTWKTRNKQATIHPRICYHGDLMQVWYSVPTGAATTPDLLFMHEARYGSNWFHDGLPATARSMVIFPNSVETLKPFIGTALSGSTYIHCADTGTQDGATSFLGYVTTKPYAIGSLWQKFRMMAAVLLARATTGTTLNIRLIRNFGLETKDVTALLTASAANESHVIKPLDNATMSELNVVQLKYGDGAAASAQAWSVDQISAHMSAEEGSA